jgi:hypothetical protein
MDANNWCKAKGKIFNNLADDELTEGYTEIRAKLRKGSVFFSLSYSFLFNVG